MKMRRCLLPWVACATLLGGCGGMLTSDQPPENVYWLEATTLRLGEPQAEGLPELIVVVHTIPGLDTDAILVKGPGARMNYYAGARWPDHLPEVVTATVRLSLESSGRFSRVSSRSQTDAGAWVLDLELREFFAVANATDAAPQVRVQLAGHINCGRRETAINARASAAAQENTLSRIVGAFQSAVDSSMIDLGEQLKSSCFSEHAGSDTQ